MKKPIFTLAFFVLTVSSFGATADPMIGSRTVWPKDTTVFTLGSIPFAGSSGQGSENNSKLFWDNTNFRLGIGTASPTMALDLTSSGSLNANNGTFATSVFATSKLTIGLTTNPSSAATNPGKLLVYDVSNVDGPNATGNGIEFQNSTAGNGYGYKFFYNGTTNTAGFATRYNSASWTVQWATHQQTGATTFAGSVSVGSGAAMVGIYSATATLDFPNTSAQSSADLTITVTGAAANDVVIVGPPTTVNANTSFSAFVSAADTVTVRFNNYSSAAVNPASATFRATVIHY